MKEITIEFIKAFIASKNIPYIATQSRLSIPIIFRIYQKMLHGIKFDEIKIYDNLIIDGHHRYLSALLINADIGKVESNATSATIAVEWTEVEFDEKDWDTPAKIAHLNEIDAKYNGVEIEFVNQIILG